MNHKPDPVLVMASKFRFDQERLERTREYESLMKDVGKMTAAILNVSKKGKTVEELIKYETTLQKADRLINITPTANEEAYMKSAEAGYKMISAAVEQMREDPAAYFKANASLKEVGDDYKKFPTSRLSTHINANVQRLRNRAIDLLEPQKILLEARVALAKATLGKLKELHNTVVKSYDSPPEVQPEVTKRNRKV